MYNECHSCQKLGEACDGPNFLTLSAHDLLEWCKKQKAQRGLSNAKVSEASGVPAGTVGRLFSGDHADCKYETMRLIVRGVVGEFKGHPCPEGGQDDVATLQKLENENKRLRAKSRKERRLFIALFAVVGVIAILALAVLSYFLIYDFMHPGSGIVIW